MDICHEKHHAPTTRDRQGSSSHKSARGPETVFTVEGIASSVVQAVRQYQRNCRCPNCHEQWLPSRKMKEIIVERLSEFYGGVGNTSPRIYFPFAALMSGIAA